MTRPTRKKAPNAQEGGDGVRVIENMQILLFLCRPSSCVLRANQIRKLAEVRCSAGVARARGRASVVPRSLMPAEASRPAQTVYLIRHGESSANAAMNAGVQSAYLLEDALLTAEGIAQAKSIRHSPVMLNQPPPELLLVSPLRRTMQTAVLAFGEDVPHQLRPDIQETGRTPCDKGCPPLGAALLDEMKWAAYSDSYSKLADQWHMKAPDWKQVRN